jgi:hypothetical protein
MEKSYTLHEIVKFMTAKTTYWSHRNLINLRRPNFDRHR